MSETHKDKGCLDLALGHIKKFEIYLRICANVHNLLHNTIFASVHSSKDRIAHTSNKATANAITNKV